MSQLTKAGQAVSAACRTGGKRLIVIGAGLSGLSYVHYIRNFMALIGQSRIIDKITILEANNHMGGCVKSTRFNDGSIHELGPRVIRVAGVRATNTISLLEQLNLSDEIKTFKTGKNNVDAGQRFIYYNHKLSKLNLNFLHLFNKLPNCKNTRLINAFLRDVYKAKKMDLTQYQDNDPSLYDFIKHRFGQEPADMILDPLIRFLNATHPQELSTRALFPDIINKEQAYGSIIKGVGRPPVTKMSHDELFPNDVLKSKLLEELKKQRVLCYTISNGLETIPEYLSNSLLNTNQDNLISIYNQTKVKSIHFTDYASLEADIDSRPPCSAIVETIEGDEIKLEADYIVSTISAPDLSNLIKEDTIPASSQRKSVLNDIINIKHVPLGSVVVEYRNLSKLKEIKSLKSTGILTHSKSNSRVLGINLDSLLFPDMDERNGSFRINVTLGGDWFKETFKTDNPNQVTNAQMEQIALEDLEKILNIKDEPYRMSSVMWKTGYPKYTPGHKERLDRVRDELVSLNIPLILLGQSYDGFAMNDVIFTARMAAYNFVKALVTHTDGQSSLIDPR